MQLENFEFALPPERIALHPINPRDKAKLLVVEKKSSDSLTDDFVFNLPSYLHAGDMLVLNNSFVMPAKISGTTKNGTKIDVLLCYPKDNYIWQVMMKGKPEEIIFTEKISAHIVGGNELKFNINFNDMCLFLHDAGKMPLPPYIENKRPSNKKDFEDYQTLFCKNSGDWGSIAAPTAGLHFTPKLLADLKAKQIEILELTLHVGVGTFMPVRSEHIEAHKMLPERAVLTPSAAEKINQAKSAGRRIIAVGTTSLRLLESATTNNGSIQPFEGTTDLFIYPNYEFKMTDGLLTNFHLPKSTPLLLVSALMGTNRIKSVYEHAVNNSYRFFSYGDACLLIP